MQSFFLTFGPSNLSTWTRFVAVVAVVTCVQSVGFCRHRIFGAHAWLERLRVRESLHEVLLSKKNRPDGFVANSLRGADSVSLEQRNDEFLSWFHVDVFFKLWTLGHKLRYTRGGSTIVSSPSSSSSSTPILFIFLQALTSITSNLSKVIVKTLPGVYVYECIFTYTQPPWTFAL